MADKSFGVKELNLLNASGTPTVTSPNNLNLNANTVAISTSCTIGNNLTVTSTTNSANLNVTGIGTLTRAFATDLSVSGVTTITVPANANPHSSWDVVNNGASAYRFTGPGQDGAENNPDIYLVRGQRYVFKMNASGHPFQIRVANGGAAYSDGVTNNGAQTGNVVFNVQHDAPAQLYYQCTSHGGMVGNIYIVGQHLANGANDRILTATSAYGMNAESNLQFDGTNLFMPNELRHLGDPDTKMGFDTDTIKFDTAGSLRVTIDSSGRTHFGNGGLNDSNVVSIIPSDGRISFGMDGRTSLVTGENGCYIFSGQGATGSPLAGELVLQSRSNQDRDIFFATGSTPTFRARFRGSDGDFFLGNDLPTITNKGVAFRENDTNNTYMEMGHGTTGANYSYVIFRFGGSGTTIGNIAQNTAGNGVSYNTTSDYRLKTNEALITDGITRIKQLKPYKFEWKSDLGTKVDGFFAHEVSSIVPDAVSGEKDAVETTYYDEEKNLPEGKSVGDVKETDRPVYQSIDHSKLVPLLTAALQEAITEIESLKARVATLEGS